MDQPEYLYHGSPETQIEIFEPRAEGVRDKKEGPVVFGSPSRAFAAMFLVPSDDSWTTKSRIGDSYYHIISDRERYLREDKGGAIYTLPSLTFVSDPTKGMGKGEWTSKAAVAPVKTEVFKSGLEAQKSLGVQICFVGTEEFREMKDLLRERKYEEALAMIKGFKTE